MTASRIVESKTNEGAGSGSEVNSEGEKKREHTHSKKRKDRDNAKRKKKEGKEGGLQDDVCTDDALTFQANHDHQEKKMGLSERHCIALHVHICAPISLCFVFDTLCICIKKNNSCDEECVVGR